jgi:hypothetical protein
LFSYGFFTTALRYSCTIFTKFGYKYFQFFLKNEIKTDEKRAPSHRFCVNLVITLARSHRFCVNAGHFLLVAELSRIVLNIKSLSLVYGGEGISRGIKIVANKVKSDRSNSCSHWRSNVEAVLRPGNLSPRPHTHTLRGARRRKVAIDGVSYPASERDASIRIWILYNCLRNGEVIITNNLKCLFSIVQLSFI